MLPFIIICFVRYKIENRKLSFTLTSGHSTFLPPYKLSIEKNNSIAGQLRFRTDKTGIQLIESQEEESQWLYRQSQLTPSQYKACSLLKGNVIKHFTEKYNVISQDSWNYVMQVFKQNSITQNFKLVGAGVKDFSLRDDTLTDQTKS